MAEQKGVLTVSRVLIIGVVVVIIVLGAALIIMAITRSGTQVTDETRPNALANSNNECVVCHERTTPGIVQQYGHSTMAVANVKCQWKPLIRGQKNTKAPMFCARPRRPCVKSAMKRKWRSITRAGTPYPLTWHLRVRRT